MCLGFLHRRECLAVDTLGSMIDPPRRAYIPREAIRTRYCRSPRLTPIVLTTRHLVKLVMIEEHAVDSSGKYLGEDSSHLADIRQETQQTGENWIWLTGCCGLDQQVSNNLHTQHLSTAVVPLWQTDTCICFWMNREILPSMVTSKPAISGHRKTGQRRASETKLF